MLRILISDFNIKSSVNFKSISIDINRTGIFKINGSHDQINDLIKAITGCDIDFIGHISLNNISIKKDKIVQRYLQKNSLFLVKISLINDFSVIENLRYFSKFWSGEDLSDASAVGFGFETNFLKKKVKDLNLEEKNLVNLVKILTCNSYIWWIKNDFLLNLSDEMSKKMVDNIIDIRIKQGGVIILI